jgi:enamine deaminase RidA (YjgF/YER057c/UK114 family)
MGRIDDRLAELGLELPEPFAAPAGVEFKFEPVRAIDGVAFISGHGPVDGDRTLVSGKVGDSVSLEEAVEAARLTGLAIFSSLRTALGDLDRVTGWGKAFGMVNCAPGFNTTPAVINGFSSLVLDVWGPDAGRHSRSAIGVAELPFDWPVEIEGLVEVS